MSVVLIVMMAAVTLGASAFTSPAGWIAVGCLLAAVFAAVGLRTVRRSNRHLTSRQ